MNIDLLLVVIVYNYEHYPVNPSSLDITINNGGLGEDRRPTKYDPIYISTLVADDSWNGIYNRYDMSFIAAE